MVRVYLYEKSFEGYKIPLFDTILVGIEEFKRLYAAGIAFKVGKQYGMYV